MNNMREHGMNYIENNKVVCDNKTNLVHIYSTTHCLPFHHMCCWCAAGDVLAGGVMILKES